MDAERAGRVVSALRARGVMAHLAEAGVYEFGIRVVLDAGIEALWDVDGAAGLDAEIVSEGVLIGLVPHIPGSEKYDEQQLVDAIAQTEYALEGLNPPVDTPPVDRPEDSSPPRSAPPGTPHPVARNQRRAHWIRRHRP